MNLENMSAENRNAYSVASNIRNIIRSQRRCSFCRMEGHTINNCNDSRIDGFENLCKAKKDLFDSHWNDGITLNRLQSKSHFENWLMQYSLEIMEYSSENINVVKAFSLSRCGGLLRDSIDITIDIITRHIYRELPEEEMEDDNSMPSLIADTDTDEEFIPFEATQEVSQFDITLFMTLTSMFSLQYDASYNLIDTNAIRDLLNQMKNKTPSIKVTNMVEELTAENIDKNLYTQHDCNICYDTKDHYEFVKLNCKHEFCNKCIIDTIKMCNASSKEPFCGFCRKNIDTINTRSEEINDEITNALNL